MRRCLVLGAMPADASPQTHIAAGPWCFAGQEERFPDWPSKWQFAPEPLADPLMLVQAAQSAISLCLGQIRLLAAWLEPGYASFPGIYWEMLLAPWAICVASQLVERKLRCDAMIGQFGDEALVVPILEKNNLEFQDEQDFVLRGELGMDYNFYVFSALLNNNWPSKWEKKPVVPNARGASGKNPGRGIFKNALRDALLRLPFPKMKGMSLAQAFKFSHALLRPSHLHTQTMDLTDKAADCEEGIGIDGAVELFKAALPRSIKELRHDPKKVRASQKPRLKFASILAYEDAAYRQRLAYWLASGNRLGFAQHGGNYGQAKTVCNSALVEYAQSVFITWGWKKHGEIRGNFLPLPSPQLSRIRNAWRPAERGPMLFVGAEMAAFPYRLESRPTPLQYAAYRQAKADFLTACGSEIERNTFYRPYFQHPGLLEDGPWLLRRFSGLRLCEGPLIEHLLQCRLLVLDHHGTVMLEALAANAPLIMYWDRKFWPMTNECEKLLDLLADCGIWHDSPIKAAAKAREIMSGDPEWHKAPAIQAALNAARRLLASTAGKDLDAIWIKALKGL